MTGLRDYLLLCSVSVLTGCSVHLHAANLLDNGGFEGGFAPWRAGLGPELSTWYAEGPEAAAGRGFLRFQCDGTLASADHPELRFGAELSRLGTYRIRAQIQNHGVQHGNFGLRLYFRDRNGQFLAMGGGISVTPQSPLHGWKPFEVRFGRGTRNPIPPGAARLMVRFSFWAEDGQCRGDVRLDEVTLEQTADAARDPDQPPTAVLWRDRPLETTIGEGARGLDALLAARGFEVKTLNTDEIAATGMLDIAAVDAVVLPYGPWYPATMASALMTYAAEGGVIAALGTHPLTEPLYLTESGWMPRTAALPGTVATAVPLEPDEALGHAGPDDVLHTSTLPGEQGIRMTTEPLNGYAYAGTALPPAPANDLVVSFEARGDRATARLCLELKETDGSRWKAMVPLREEWQTYRLHLGEFISYANEELGRADGAIHPRDVTTLMLGFTGAMVGKGPHVCDVRNLRLEPAAVPTEVVVATPSFVPHERSAVIWFGKHAIAGERVPLPAAVETGAAWEARRLRVPKHALLPDIGGMRGAFSGVTVAPKAEAEIGAGERREKLAGGLRQAGAVDQITFLETAGLFARNHPVGTLVFQRSGRFAGSRWIHLGLHAPDLEAQAPLAAALGSALELACKSIYVDALRPRFRVDNGQIVLDVVVSVRNLSPRAMDASLKVRVVSEGAEVYSGDTSVSLRGLAGVSTVHTAVEGLSLDRLSWQDFGLSIESASGDPALIGPKTFAFNALDSLRRICDMMVDEGADDATFHGYSFVDNRGARALLGAYEILGGRVYRRTAFRWGDLMLELQREDGGYRMGYGITSKGEACFVADGGEIAVAIARLISYARGERRAALRASLDAYMAYRESFRVPSGGIGVGWCLHDYGKRPILPLKEPTRIFAPERNTYTIGCTLAAAYAQAAISGDPERMRQAAADADWLMPRTNALNGAFIESYIYAHYLSEDEMRRETYAAFIEKAFSERMRQASAREESWWLNGDGRSALNLGGLAYVLHQIQDDPALRAEMMRAACLMFSPDSAESVFAALTRVDARSGPWIYACFGSLGFVDVIQPLISMEGLLP